MPDFYNIFKGIYWNIILKFQHGCQSVACMNIIYTHVKGWIEDIVYILADVVISCPLLVCRGKNPWH